MHAKFTTEKITVFSKLNIPTLFFGLLSYQLMDENQHQFTKIHGFIHYIERNRSATAFKLEN